MKMGFLPVLTLVFVVFKILGFIDKWSWWLVFAPALLSLVIVTILFVFAVIGMAAQQIEEARR